MLSTTLAIVAECTLRVLRRAILPIFPLDWMDLEVGTHSFAEGREKGLPTEARVGSEALEFVYRSLSADLLARK